MIIKNIEGIDVGIPDYIKQQSGDILEEHLLFTNYSWASFCAKFLFFLSVLVWVLCNVHIL